MSLLQHKKIILAITGSIAAYKSILLARLLVKAGATVQVVLTSDAEQFVSPLVLATLTKQKVLISLANNNEWENHVKLGRWADLMIVAPATCNTLAKMSNGICDNMLLAIYMSATCPVVIAPAMDEDMWLHPATKQNIATLKQFGHHILQVNHGELASGLIGEGRLMEPEHIVTHITEQFFRGTALSGKKIMVTAGPTHEAIDPVRYISNHSTGKMGYEIAKSLYEQGADVLLISGPSHEQIPYCHLPLIKVKSAQDMFNAVINQYQQYDAVIMTAAVADYTVPQVADQKIKKQADEFSLNLTKTTDILKHLGHNKPSHIKLIGFALETEHEEQHALKKLHDKKADAIILNSLNDAGAGFATNTNKITIYGTHHAPIAFPLLSKAETAAQITSYIINHIFQ